MNYPINEVFATIQGEATFTGTPSIFIRLQGCNVACPWCDTKHTWELAKNEQINFTQLITKDNDGQKWANVELAELVTYLQSTYPLIKHVVITGGEPAMYDLTDLCKSLENIGKTIQLETSGTEDLKVTPKTWVTLSPKINMPGGKKILNSVVDRANEIKMPIGKFDDITKLQTFISNYLIKDIPIWLQPLSQNPSATKLCIEQALTNNWKLSLQTHKFINIR